MANKHRIGKGNSIAAFSIQTYFLLLHFPVTILNLTSKASTGFQSTCVSNTCNGENQGNGNTRRGIHSPQTEAEWYDLQ